MKRFLSFAVLSLIMVLSAKSFALGTPDDPIPVDRKVISVGFSETEDADNGVCTVATYTLELSAPGLAPGLAIEQLISCTGGAKEFDGGRDATQYAPGGTCARGQGLRSTWTGGGTVQNQYVSYERGGSFYVAYGSCHYQGCVIASPFTWSMKLTSLDRIYAATMTTTSPTFAGAGTSCF